MDNKIYNSYIKILEHELIPALGCTEPIAIAFCAAKAAEVLGREPERIVVESSGNIIKNVKAVTVPNSNGLKGIDVAAVLGAVGGNAAKELEVLSEITDVHIARTIELLEDATYCVCKLLEGVENLHIIVSVSAGNESALVEIQSSHTHITRIEKNGKNIFTQSDLSDGSDAYEEMKQLLNVKDILAFADVLNVEDVRQVLERQITYNTAISQEGLTHDYGARVGKTLLASYDASNPVIRARAAAAAGSDARMSGCSLPVVINSGSGNQGITVTMPVLEYAKVLNADKDKCYRALALANLISLHQKRFIGRLSAYCGAVSAACGAACGVAYLYGAGYEEISCTIINAITNIGGMVCDGAKPSCAAKISSAVDASLLAFNLQKNGGCFAAGEGLVKQDVEATIRAVGKMGHDGMKSTDVEILNIMLGCD
ncbi:MAG: serine dehydratase subunit alpha family protein [Candidatus Fimivivens sp.]